VPQGISIHCFFTEKNSMNQYNEPLYNQAYVDTGEGNPVILLHGLFGNVTMWRATVNMLQPHFKVIVPKLPLFDIPIHRANIDHLVEVLHEFLTWRQLTNVTLVGTDIGGQVALCYAHLYPERVKKLILSGSSGLFENIPEFDSNYAHVHDQVRDAFYRKELATPNVIDKVYKTVNTASKGLHIKFFARSSQKTNITSFLYKLNIPVLLLWGLQDKITPPEVALHFHDLLRYGTVNFIDRCGHLPMIEQAETYAQSIISFLDS
jgi:2-hydroxy-6-oxonona-2,4-dienedioate hydrolase